MRKPKKVSWKKRTEGLRPEQVERMKKLVKKLARAKRFKRR